MVVFERPVGAGPDTKELEFISAIHQTGTTVRSNGSIMDEDIKLYLRSRFGIEVTLEQVRSTILHGFGGGDEGDADDGEVIDLMELTTIILIPLLLKASIVEGNGMALPEGILPPPDRLLQDVIDMVVHDSGSTASFTKDGAPVVTAELVRKILLIYGETQMADDERLIQEMLDACGDNDDNKENDDEAGGDGQVTFVPSSFGRALTRDVTLFDLTNETKQSSLIQDVFGHTRNTPRRRAKDRRANRDPTLDATAATSMLASNSEKTKAEEPDVQNAIERVENQGQEIQELTRIFTAPAIDIQAGTYRSKLLAVTVWGSVLFGLILSILQNSLYVGNEECGDLYYPDGSFGDNFNGMMCDTTTSIYRWLIYFGMFCLLGMTAVGLSSLGNYVGNTRWYLPLLGLLCMFFWAFYEPIFEDLPTKSYLIFIYFAQGIMGAIAMYCHFTHMLTIIFKKYDFTKSKWGPRLGFNALTQELNMKKAAAFKVNQLVTNARDIHYRAGSTSIFKTYFGHALSVYTLHGTEYVRTGGFFWFWRKFRDRTIFKEEGLWYSARLVAANMTQFFSPILILLMGLYYMDRVIDNYNPDKSKEQLDFVVGWVMDKAVDTDKLVMASLGVVDYVVRWAHNFTGDINCTDIIQLNDTGLCYPDPWGTWNCSTVPPVMALCTMITASNLSLVDPNLQVALLEQAGISIDEVFETVQTEVVAALDLATTSLYPDELYMLTVPLGIAIFFAIVNAIRLAVTYLPSVTTTIIQLRTGVIKSLGDPEFEKYRVAPDTVTLLTGTIFWGALVSSALFGLVVGLIFFLLLWQGTQRLVQRLTVLLIGLIIVIIIRLAFVSCCKCCCFKGLYRTRPAGANITMLGLEWANYMFTTAFILVRMFKLVLVAVSSIGTIDRRFLAPGVGQIGPLELDPYPTIHTRDLVAHEAHRHPYIETLGVMYLMKLRYADSFANRAGSAWRLIFVYALMPWFHKYRIRVWNEVAVGPGDDATAGEQDDESPSKKATAMSLVSPRVSSSAGGQDDEKATARSLVTPRVSTKWNIGHDSQHVEVDMVEDHHNSDENDRDQAMREMEAEISRLKEHVQELSLQLEVKKKKRKSSGTLATGDSKEFQEKEKDGEIETN